MSHSKIKTNDESYCEDATVRVVFNFIKPGEDMVRTSRSWEICGGRDRSGLIDSPQQVIQNRIMIVLGLLKSGNVRSRRTIDRGNLMKLLGTWCNKLVLIMEMLFSTEVHNP